MYELWLEYGLNDGIRLRHYTRHFLEKKKEKMQLLLGYKIDILS